MGSRMDVSCHSAARGATPIQMYDHTLRRVVLTVLLLGSLGGELSTATPVRLLGMGDLSLVVEDESNMINLHDFGGNVAGLCLDEDRSALEGVFSYSTRELVDTNGVLEPELNIWGDPFPSEIVGLVDHMPPLFLIRETPVSFSPSGGSFIHRTSRMAVEARGSYSQCSSDSVGYLRNTNTPFGSVRINRLLGRTFSLGLLGGYTGPKQSDSQGDHESSITNLHGGLGVGMRIGRMAVLGGNLNSNRLGIEREYLECHTTTTFEGRSLGGGLQGILHIPAVLKLGINSGYGKLSTVGETNRDGSVADIGNTEQVDSRSKTRFLTTIPSLPVQLAASAGYGMTSAIFEPSLGGLPLSRTDTTYTEIPLGIGTVYSRSGFILGAEFHYCAAKVRDNEDDWVIRSRRMGGNLGAELSPGEAVSLRGGWAVGLEDPDLEDENDGLLTHRLTGGLGLTLPGRLLKWDLAYNHVVSYPKADSAELKRTGNLFALAIKWSF